MISAVSRTWMMVALTASLLCWTLPELAHAKTPEARLAPPDATIGARVGASVAVDKDLIVLGAPDDDEAGPFAGAVYVYVRQGNTWEEMAKLLGPATAGFRSFGESVAATRDLVVVGAPFDGPAGEAFGAVYVYARYGKEWTLQARLTPSDAAPVQLFGDAVAIDDHTIVVGAFLDGEQAPNAGAVYVFSRTGDDWTQTAKLTASDASEYAFFGSAIAISAGKIVVGSPTSETAYVFSEHQGRWREQAILTAADASVGDFSAFGAAVAIDHATVVIGAPLEGTPSPKTGAAYVFKNKGNTWVQQSKLRASDAAGEDEFGTSVAVDGRHIAVGAPYHDSSNNGAVYLFAAHGQQWTESNLLTGQPPTAFLGASVALEGDALVGGAPAFVDFTGLQSAGAAYVFRARE